MQNKTLKTYLLKSLSLTSLSLSILFIASITINCKATSDYETMRETYNRLCGTYTLKENPQDWQAPINTLILNREYICVNGKMYDFATGMLITKDEFTKTTNPRNSLNIPFDIDYSKEIYIKLDNNNFLEVHPYTDYYGKHNILLIQHNRTDERSAIESNFVCMEIVEGV